MTILSVKEYADKNKMSLSHVYTLIYKKLLQGVMLEDEHGHEYQGVVIEKN